MKSKIILVVLAVLGLYGIAAWAIQHWIILPSFIELERQEANNNMSRAVAAISRELLVLDNMCHDYAAWDDTYAFISNHNQEYLDSNIIAETYKDLSVNLILYFDAQGRYVAGNAYDLLRGELLPADQLVSIGPGHPLLAHKSTTDTISGIMETKRGPMLVSSQAIITSENYGPIKGAVIIGWLLDESRMMKLNDQLVIDLAMIPIDAVSSDDRIVLQQLAANGNQVITVEQNSKLLTAYKTLPGINGEPIILLKASLARDILAAGLLTMHNSLLSTFVAGILVILVLGVSIHFLIANPVMRLVDHLAAIKQSGELKVIGSVARTDEVGALYDGFNALTEQLAEKNRAKAVIEQEKETLIAELQEALARVQMLSGLLPICSSCKMIRDDRGRWNQIESYIKRHSNADFSHGICPDCARKLYPDLFAEEMLSGLGGQGKDG